MLIWQRIFSFWLARDGASSAEYALILALIGAGVVPALMAVNTSMLTAMSNTGSAMPFQGP